MDTMDDVDDGDAIGDRFLIIHCVYSIVPPWAQRNKRTAAVVFRDRGRPRLGRNS